jgi:FkbM family methyltransferase
LDRIEFLEYDIYSDTPLPGTAYDAAIAVEVMQHHPHDVVYRLIERLARIADWIVDYDWSEDWAGPVPPHVWVHDYEQIYRALGLECTVYVDPQKINGQQPKLFVAAKQVCPPRDGADGSRSPAPTDSDAICVESEDPAGAGRPGNHPGVARANAATSQPTFHSQYGEDRWILEHVPLPERGFFVDVGAGDGVAYSNTLAFERLGWRGVCIDADPRSYLKLIDRRQLAFFSAVRAVEGVTEMFVNDHVPDYTRATGPIGTGRTIVVPSVPLGVLLQRLRLADHIDVLSVDVEGLELEVLQSFDMARDYPTVVVVEHFTRGLKDQRSELLDFFAPLPYQLVYETQANLVFSLGDRFELVRR